MRKRAENPGISETLREQLERLIRSVETRLIESVATRARLRQAAQEMVNALHSHQVYTRYLTLGSKSRDQLN